MPKERTAGDDPAGFPLPRRLGGEATGAALASAAAGTTTIRLPRAVVAPLVHAGSALAQRAAAAGALALHGAHGAAARENASSDAPARAGG